MASRIFNVILAVIGSAGWAIPLGAAFIYFFRYWDNLHAVEDGIPVMEVIISYFAMGFSWMVLAVAFWSGFLTWKLVAVPKEDE